MKFSISLFEIQYLLKFLRICVKLSSTEPSARVNIKAEEGSVIFYTSDSINHIKVSSITSDVREDGVASVLYTDLHPFINSFKPVDSEGVGVDLVTFRLNEKSLSMSVKNNHSSGSSSKSSVRIPIFNYHTEEDMFSFNSTTFVLGSSMLKATIDKISFTLDPAHNVTFLRGASLIFTEDYIHFAGTNGIVISEHTVQNTSGVVDNQYILSYDFVKGFKNILSSIMSKEEVFISFLIDGGKIKIKVDNIVFVGNLVIGYEFPDYRSVLLKDRSFKLVLEKDVVMSNIVPIINLLDKDDNHRMTINVNKNDFSFYGTNFDGGGFDTKFQIDDSIDSDIKIDVNGRLFKDIVSCIKDSKLIMKFTDENDAVFLDSEMFEDQKCLITPIKRRNN